MPPSGNLEQSHLSEERRRVAPQQKGAKGENENLAHHGSDAFLNRCAVLLGNAHWRIMYQSGFSLYRPLWRSPLVITSLDSIPPSIDGQLLTLVSVAQSNAITRTQPASPMIV